MARARKRWDAILPELYVLLAEEQGDSTWTDAQLLILWNEARDEREMQLHLAHEGFGVVRMKRSLVANQAQYDLPADAGRVVRVLRRFSDGSEKPLVRTELISEGESRDSVGNDRGYMPTYRFLGVNLVLIPPPSQAETDGIIIEMAQLPDEFSGNDSTLPLDWPIFTERLLTLDVAYFAYEMEAATSAEGDPPINPYARRRARYEEFWMQYIEERSQGRVFAQPFNLGD
jgi:hypothetical protein